MTWRQNSSEYYIICIFNYYNTFNVRKESAKFAEHLYLDSARLVDDEKRAYIYGNRCKCQQHSLLASLRSAYSSTVRRATILWFLVADPPPHAIECYR